MLALPARGQEPAAPDMTTLVNGYERAAHSSFVGIPTDWSTRHVVFSSPEPGSHAEDQTQQDPRYWLQQIAALSFNPMTLFRDRHARRRRSSR